MITNERQYRITRTQIQKLKTAIDSFSLKDTIKRTGVKDLAKAELNALKSEYEVLSIQLRVYETLKSGKIEILKASSLEELPNLLIRARIARGLSQRELADSINIKEQQIQRYEAEEYASANLNRLIQVARALELNISEIAELNKTPKIVQISDNELPWEEFPIREIYRRNWFQDYFSGSLSEAIDNGDELIREFITDALDQPISAAAMQRIRSGGIVNLYALLAFQCRVIHLARKEKPHKTFKKEIITNTWLKELAKLSRKERGPLEAIIYLQQNGIRLVIVPHLTYTHLDGISILLNDGPVIGMTLRYDRVDNFWFVLFHELIHVKKHLHKGKVEAIFDDLDQLANDIEMEADHEAAEILVPENVWETALARYLRSKETIEALADELNISPAIIAGKIRKEAENYTILTDMIGQGEVRKLFPNVDFSY